MSEEPLTLDELQAWKTDLEGKAARLRKALHTLATERTEGWRAEFSGVQEELFAATSRIGQLNQRICALVEGSIVTEEDDTDE